MDTQTPLSNATWREIDRDTGRLPDTQVRRLRWLVPLFLVGVAVLGASGLLDVNLQPPPRPKPAPVFPATDGLPEVLTAGAKYPTSFQVEFPADWPDQQGAAPGTTAANVTVTGRGKWDNAPLGIGKVAEIIFCSTATDYAAGHSVTLDCIITAPSPGPFTLHLYADTQDLPPPGNDSGSGNHTSRAYQHTVQPPEHP